MEIRVGVDGSKNTDSIASVLLKQRFYEEMVTILDSAIKEYYTLRGKA